MELYLNVNVTNRDFVIVLVRWNIYSMPFRTGGHFRTLITYPFLTSVFILDNAIFITDILM